jgi:hypothetical protein
MKKLILILLLFSFTVNAQERKEKCVTIKVEQIKDYRVKITTVNTCKNEITVRTMLKKKWDSIQKKRKTRKKRN